MLPPFDHADVIAGQGTLGPRAARGSARDRDLHRAALGRRADRRASPARSRRPIRSARIVGVTMAQGAAMYESRKAGRPVEVEETASLADSLGGGIGLDNRYTFAMVRELVDDLLLVERRPDRRRDPPRLLVRAADHRGQRRGRDRAPCAPAWSRGRA